MPKTRLSSGCCAAHTAAATAPARAPRAVTAWSKGMARLYPRHAWRCRVTAAWRAGIPCVERQALLERARSRGVNPLVYWLVRAVLQPFFHLYFRMSRIGREHIPQEGPVILAANHRSFLDPFVIGCMVR